jgi:hypothetical protein
MKRPCIGLLLLLSACDANPAPKTPAAEGGNAGATGSPTPEQVCAHTDEILDAEMATAKTKREKEDARKDCLDRANAEQRDDPPRWACESGCTMAATSFDGLRGCDEKCKR